MRIIVGQGGPGDRDARPVPRFHASVVMYEGVEKRIHSCLEASAIEEGGKLLGRIEEDGDSFRIIVQTYIDSGPRVDNSRSHLHPDGVYQEALFRAVETFDPDIEHIGSWHSHHCNGYPDLSEGDIDGYLASVNDPSYNLNLFLAILVTSVSTEDFRARFFVFRRGERQFVELPSSQVRTVKDTFGYETLLNESEQLSLRQRRHATTSPSRRASPEDRTNEEFLRRVRAQDRAWIMERYPSCVAVRDRHSGAVSWKWEPVPGLVVRYRYEASVQASEAASGTISVYQDSRVIMESRFNLDARRFSVLERTITAARQASPQEQGADPAD